ncbi:MAG: hypothetical protein ACYDCL_17945 [Myxococcales bacterium]
MRRAGLAIAALSVLGACVLPEPITEEPPPSHPDQAPVILATSPPQRIVDAQPNANGACTISIGLPLVDDPSGATLTARVFLNDGNPDVQGTSFPLALEGSGAGSGDSTDFTLQVANQDDPQYLDLSPALSIDLGRYQALLAPPSEAAAINFVEIVISDGFSDAPSDPNGFRDPAPGKSVAAAIWYINLSVCTNLVP